MKPSRFTYHMPSTIAECLDLLAEHGDDAVIYAGGHSLMPLLRFRLAQPGHVISLRDLKSDLAKIERVGDRIRIGAMVTYAMVQRSDEVSTAVPLLPEAIKLIATPAVRSRGTICGNMCQADAASELPAVALLLEASFHLISANGNRVVSAAEFFRGHYTTARRPDEMLVAVEFPVLSRSETFAIHEVARLAGGFPMSGVAVALGAASGRVNAFRAVCFGVNPVQIRLREAESIILAEGVTPLAISRATETIRTAIKPSSDNFASAEYRSALTLTLFTRSVQDAFGRAA